MTPRRGLCTTFTMRAVSPALSPENPIGPASDSSQPSAPSFLLRVFVSPASVLAVRHTLTSGPLVSALPGVWMVSLYLVC